MRFIVRFDMFLKEPVFKSTTVFGIFNVEIYDPLNASIGRYSMLDASSVHAMIYAAGAAIDNNAAFTIIVNVPFLVYVWLSFISAPVPSMPNSFLVSVSPHMI